MTTVGTKNEAARVRWLEETLNRILPGSRILDAGAGELRFQSFCGHLDYVAQDIGRYEGKGDGSGLQTGSWDQSRLDIVSDITAIPEPEASFDAVMCIEVFEHLPDPVAALREFARLLRKGGQLILTAPFCSLTHFAPYHFYTGFNRYFFERHLPASGFEIAEMTANGNFFEYLAQEIRRIPAVSGRYASNAPGPVESLAVRIVLRMLERFAGRDAGSDELLHFGHHVRAVRR